MKHKRLIYIAIFVITLIVAIIIASVISNLNMKQIKVGVIDTNMSENYILQYDICNIMNDTEDIFISATHADMVVDVIKQRNNNCQIYLANVLYEDNTGNISDVVNAIYWLKEKRVDIICMSLTTFENNEQLKAAINDVQTNGIIVVAACLNYSNEVTYPAMYDNVISISNCRNENATICVLDKQIKDKFKNSKWGECSTSVLTAYITGEFSKQMSKSKFDLDKVITKYNTN